MTSSGQRGVTLPGDCRVHKLYNSVVDAALVYGVDETYKALDINEEGTIQDVYDNILVRDIKLQFLQVLGHCQIYPNRIRTHLAVSPVATPTTDKDPSLGEGISKKFRMEDLGLSWETVETLQCFVYPEGPQLSGSEIEPVSVPLLLTDIFGARSYAVGLKFTRPFFIQKPEDDTSGHYNLIPSDTDKCPPNSKLIYLPTCIVLVSRYPYFKFLKESLSGLYRLITDDDKDGDFWTILKHFSEKIFLVPCLPEGMLSLEVTLPGYSSATIIMPPRGDLHLDIRLNYPFLCLSVDNVLKVVAALLCEQTIIFTSSNYSIPALVIQCFLSYISPFEWRHSLIPIVPTDQIDMLGAPGINIMGCHANCQDDPEFLNIDDAVIVKLDEDQVISKLSYLPDFPELPEANRSKFKTQYQQLLEGDYEIDSLERLVLPSATERERARHNFEHYKDTTLSSLFLELLVGVFSHLSEGLRESRAVFEERLSQLSEKDQFFYRCATQTDMFSVFMMPRRMELRDSYNVLADQLKKKTRPNLKSSDSTELPSVIRRSRISVSTSILGVTPTISLPASMAKRGSVPALSIQPQISLRQTGTANTSIDEKNMPFIAWTYSKLSFFRELQCLELPSLNDKEFNRDKYVNQILEILEDMMHDKTIQACCIYLSAYYKISQGNVKNGLELFSDDLSRLGPSLVPSTQQLLELMSLLDNEEKEMLQQKKFYKQLIPRRSPDPRDRHSADYGLVRPSSKFRKKPLTHSDFSKEVKQENVAKNPETASNLFSVLQSICHTTTVSPQVFQTFLDTWKQNIQDMESAISSCSFTVSKEPHHGLQERVLAFNTSFRSHLSAHCFVILTTHRIVLLSNAGLKETTFANLHELSSSSFCKCDVSLHLIGPKTPVIKLEPQSSTSGSKGINISRRKTTDPFIGFSNNNVRDLWYRMFKEVICGWHMVFARKDPAVMNQVECHIRLLLALETTGWMNDVDNNVKHKWIQKLLSIQSKPIQLDTRATEALQYRINPNTYHIEKATIESTLFVPSSVAGGEGKLWLGLGNGCLRVYDMEEHCFDSDLKIVDSRLGKTVRVSCLLLVDFHVWVGSLNKTIHILDVETLCHVSQLSYLEDEPRDLRLSVTEPVVVWALLLNGSILGFDPETRERIIKIQVPNMIQHSYCTCFTIWREFLWVGNNRGSIAILNTVNRASNSEIILPRNDRQVEIKYLAVSSEDEIWCSVHSFPRSSDSTYLSVYNPRNQQILYTYSDLDSNHRVSFILPVKTTIWCGTKSGRIYVFSAKTENNRDGPKILDAHDDKVRSMTYTDNDLVISGSGSNDGYANVWKLMKWFDD